MSNNNIDVAIIYTTPYLDFCRGRYNPNNKRSQILFVRSVVADSIKEKENDEKHTEPVWVFAT